MSRREKTVVQSLTTDRVIDIHVKMSSQLLAYMSPEDAFTTVERYIGLIRSAYSSSTISVDRESISKELFEKSRSS